MELPRACREAAVAFLPDILALIDAQTTTYQAVSQDQFAQTGRRKSSFPCSADKIQLFNTQYAGSDDHKRNTTLNVNCL